MRTVAPGPGEQPDERGLLGTALADTVRHTGASAGVVYLLDEATRTLRLAVLCGLPEEVAWPWHRIPLTSAVPISDAVRENRLVWVGSQEDMVRTYPRVAASLPYRFALAATPLPGRSRPWGGLVLLWPAAHPERASRRERGHIAAEARRIAHVLELSPDPPRAPEQPRRVPLTQPHAYADRSPQAAADYAERLPEGTLALDLEGRITFVNAVAAALLGSTADRLLGTRPWHSLPWLDQPAVEDSYRTAVISREPVEFTALHPPDRPLRFQLYPDASGISVRITPGSAAARPHAAPDSPGPTPDRPRPALNDRRQIPTDPPDLPAVPPDLPTDDRPVSVGPVSVGSESVGFQPVGTTSGASRTAHSGRLYQLLHLASALTETVAVSDVVELVAGQVLPAFGADGLVLSAAEAGRLKITGWHGYDQRTIERLDGLPLGTDVTPAGRVLATGIPSFFADVEEMSRDFPQAPVLSGKRAWAFLPLLISGRPVGCCILSYDRPHTFTADERAVLTSLAGLVAQALDRARLYDAAQGVALGLQESLLPRSLPAVPGLTMAARYLPASHGMDVGGDFYDVIRLDDTTVAAVIGDVQGHNVAAAALMGQARTAVRATAGAPPDRVLAHTNRVLTGLGADLLVSCLYARIDLARGRAELASAGHPPPLLHRPGEEGLVVELDPAPLLGIDTGADYPVTDLALPTGSTLALYTDGLVEVPGTDPDRTAAHLAEHLAHRRDEDVERLIDRLIRRAWPNGGHTDDTALLLLRTTGRGSGSRPGHDPPGPRDPRTP
ncbi:SpoIIE family protein phosphatase [Streptomyces roseicoloratus]|uniref:SpoIIE family protein phosphatase n=1 Tax=Streptomyces roseicoloratus TaxID=2508722 RepID=UPI001009D938|nr:SpoIIE family protein phosphatase [Streptomyces roseicoloratus]